MNITEEHINVKISVDTQEAIKNTEKWRGAMNKAEGDLDNLIPDSDEFRKGIKKLTEATNEFAKNASKSDIKKEFNLAKKARDRFNENTPDYQKHQAKVEALGKALSDLEKRQKGVNTSVDKGSGFWSKFGIQGKLSLDSIKTALLGTGLGAFIIALGALVAKGAELVSIQREFEKIRAEVKQLLDIDGNELDVVTAKIKSVATTFDKDYKDVLESTNAITKQLGGTAEQNLGLIEKALLAGGDASGELIENIKEYSSQAKAAGLTTDEFLSIITSSTQQGVFSDKGIDTVKEFGLRIRQQTKPTKEALEAAFGREFTTKLFNNLNSGAITTVDALESVASQLDKTQIPANKLQTVIADVFGGPGEDAGIEYIRSLKNVNTNIEDLIDKNDEYVIATQKQLEAETKLAESQQELSNLFSGTSATVDLFSTNIKTKGIEVLIELVETLQPVGSWLARLFDYLLNGADASKEFGLGIKAMGVLINATLLPIQFMWNLLKGGIDIIGNLSLGFEELKKTAFSSINGVIESVNAIAPSFAQIPKIKVPIEDPTERIKAITNETEQLMQKARDAANAKTKKDAVKTAQLQREINKENGRKALEGFAQGIREQQPKALKAVEESVADLRQKINDKKQQIDKILDVNIKAQFIADIKAIEDKIKIEEDKLKAIVRPPIEIEQLVTITPRTIEGGSTEIDTPTIATPEDQAASFTQTLSSLSQLNEADKETQLLTQKLEIYQQEKLAAEEKIQRINQLEEEFIQAKLLRQQQIIDFQIEVNESSGIRDESLYEKKNQLLEQQTEKYVEETEKQIEQAEKLKEIEEQFAEQRKDVMVSFITDIGSEFGEFLTDQEQSSKDFGKKIVISALDTLQKIINISIAEATAKSLAQADSVTTFGVSGVIRAGILTALINGAFQVVKNQISNNFEKGGYFRNGQRVKETDVLQRGSKHAQGGIEMIDGATGIKVGELEEGEFYMAASSKAYKNNKSIVDELIFNSQYRDGEKVDLNKFIEKEDKSTSINQHQKSVNLFNSLFGEVTREFDYSNMFNETRLEKTYTIGELLSQRNVEEVSEEIRDNWNRLSINKRTKLSFKPDIDNIEFFKPAQSIFQSIRLKEEIERNKNRLNTNVVDLKEINEKIHKLEDIMLKYPTFIQAYVLFSDAEAKRKTYRETIEEAGGTYR